MTTRETYLESLARRSRCIQCKSQPRVAWIDGELRLRCNCYPKPPILEKLPKSELAKAIADPNYPTDAVTRMQADRIRGSV